MRRILLVLLVLAILISGYGLLARVWFELSSGMLANDGFLFQTVGRGILNGLTPYTDLFETKPPGSFLLHAVSWQIFGSAFLVKLVQALVLLGIPVLVALPAIHVIAGRPAKDRQVLSLLSILFGVLLSLYSANQSGWGLLESHAGVFGIAFLAIGVFQWGGPLVRYSVLGLLLLVAAGFKEPILLSILGGLLLLDTSWKSIGKSMGIAVVIAAVLGVVALLLLGYFDAFFGTYMRYMLGFHVGQEPMPLPLRAIEIWRVFTNMGVYSWSFATGLTLLWLWVPVQSLRTGRGELAVRWFLGSYLTLLAVAMGGSFYGHHFIFAIPFYAALLWVSLELLPKEFDRYVASFALLLIAAALIDTQLRFADQARIWKEADTEYRSAALVIDDVMERCGWERYLQMMPRGRGPYAYTKTSPYGPVFIHYSREIGALREFQTAYIRALQEAKLMLVTDVQETNLSEFALQYVGVHFDENPPACVGEDFSQPLPYRLLFRQDA